MAWPKKKLVELCEIFDDGDWIETKDQSSSGVRLIQTGNVGLGQFKDRHDKARYISEKTFSRLKCTEIIPGDCLVSRLPDPAGRACVIPETGSKMITAVDCTIIRFRKNTLIPNFFNYYSQSSGYLQDVDVKTSGATRKRISRKNLGEILLPVPLIAEQKQIVAILDEAFANIDHARQLAERNLKNARELIDSTLNQIFTQRGEGWHSCDLSDYVNFIDYRGKTPKKTESGLRLITAKNVRMGFLRPEPAEFVAPESYDAWMTRGIPQEGDVLFTTEAPLANVAQLDTDEKVVFAQRIIIMQPDRQFLNSTFLKYLLLSASIQKRIHDKGTGATATGIKASLLKKIKIDFPYSVQEQERIIKLLDSISIQSKKLEEIYIQKITALDELKQSLLQKAFRGELTQDQAAA